MSGIRRDPSPEVESASTENSGLKTKDWPQRSCGRCACAATVLNGPTDELICVSSPAHAGHMVRVAGGATSSENLAASCRAFRAKPEPALRSEPPMPAGDSACYIPLPRGAFAIVDATDYEWLSAYRWQIVGEGYVRAAIKGKNIFMHRLIMNPPAGKVVDHINRNRWDNRRGNLRECTQAENLRNRRGSYRSSRFKGVHWNARIRKWVAAICLNRQMIHLGYFTDEAEAARAYDRKARELFGSFAYLNFPGPARIVLLSGTIYVRSHVRGHLRGTSTIKDQKSKLQITIPKAHRRRRFLHFDFYILVLGFLRRLETGGSHLSTMTTGPPRNDLRRC